MSTRESGRRVVGAATLPPASGRPRVRGLALSVDTFFVAWRVWAFALVEWDDHLRPFLLRRIHLDGVRVALWVVPVCLYLRYVDRTHPLRFLGITTHPDVPAVLRGAVVAAIYPALGLLVGVLVEGRRLVAPWALGLDRWLEMSLTLPIACLAEEVLSRGFLLTKTRDLMGPWRAVLLTSLLFAAIHRPGWIASGACGERSARCRRRCPPGLSVPDHALAPAERRRPRREQRGFRLPHLARSPRARFAAGRDESCGRATYSLRASRLRLKTSLEM